MLHKTPSGPGWIAHSVNPNYDWVSCGFWLNDTYKCGVLSAHVLFDPRDDSPAHSLILTILGGGERPSDELTGRVLIDFGFDGEEVRSPGPLDRTFFRLLSKGDA